jgi:hypothetical protein
MTFAELKALAERFKIVQSVIAELEMVEHPDDEHISEAHEARLREALDPPEPAAPPA